MSKSGVLWGACREQLTTVDYDVSHRKLHPEQVPRQGVAVEGYARVCCYQRTYNPSQLMAARAAAPVRAHKGGWGGDA